MLNRDAALRNLPQVSQPQTELQPPPRSSVPVEAPLTPQPTEVSTPPPQVSTFYSDLSPYGTWVDLEGVGWCWQPTVVVVNRGWQPYCDGGHWVYTEGWLVLAIGLFVGLGPISLWTMANAFALRMGLDS